MHTVKQIVGARDNQEDSCLAVTLEPGGATVEPPSTLYIVADGMGGHAAGEIASRCAVQGFRESIEIQQRDGRIELASAIRDANYRIREAADSSPSLRGMGTTLAAALLEGGRVSWISVGDSPFLLYRDGKLHRLNQDHSMLPLLLEEAWAKGLGDEYAYSNPRRHHLRSSLAGQDMGLIDQGTVDAKDKDIFILASDGVDTLSTDTIKNVLASSRHEPLDQISENLMAEIEKLAVPHQDNTTLLLFTAGTNGAKPPSWTRPGGLFPPLAASGKGGGCNLAIAVVTRISRPARRRQIPHRKRCVCSVERKPREVGTR